MIKHTIIEGYEVYNEDEYYGHDWSIRGTLAEIYQQIWNRYEYVGGSVTNKVVRGLYKDVDCTMVYEYIDFLRQAYINEIHFYVYDKADDMPCQDAITCFNLISVHYIHMNLHMYVAEVF